MRKLSSLGFRYSRHRKSRTALTGLGIALGVGIFFATMVSNATTAASLSRIIGDFVGRSDVWVTSTEFDNYDERDVETIRALPDVALAVPRIGKQATVDTDSDGFVLYGTEITDDREIYRYILEPGGRLPRRDTDEIVVPRTLASRLEVGVGSVLEISADGRKNRWTVSGVLEDRGVGRNFNGEFALGWLRPVQRALGLSGKVDNTALVLERGVDPVSWINDHSDELPEGLNALEPGAGGEFLDLLSATQGAFFGVSTVAVIVAIFLVYNSLSMSLAERVQVYGTLRALGASRRQITRTVLVEAVVLGALGTVAGIVLGLGLARVLIGLMEGIFEGDVALQTFTVPRGALVVAILVGMAVTVIASLVPARRAGRVDPVVAMRNVQATTGDRRLGRSWIVGAALIGLTFLLSFARFEFPLNMIVTLPALVGAILIVPLVLRPAGTAVGALVQPIARGVGRVAVGHLTKERSRSSLTLGILMAVLGMILTIGTINVSLGNAILGSIDRQFGSDFVVERSQDDNGDALDPEVSRRLERLPEVALLSPITFHRGVGTGPDGEDVTVFVDGIDPQTIFETSAQDFVSGGVTAAKEGMRAGGIMLTERAADALDAETGDVIEVRTPSGRREMPVVSVVTSAQFVNIAYTDERVTSRYFERKEPSIVNVDLAPGVSAAAGEKAIRRALRGQEFALEDKTGLKADVRKEFNGFFAPFWAILATAVVVGLLGIANTLAMVVLQRFREFGVLRAIGVGRGGVRRMVLVESLTMAGVAFVLAIPLGIYLSSSTLDGVLKMTGYQTNWTFPVTWALYAFVIAAVVGVIGALLPGRRAARIKIVEALAYE